MVWLVGWGVGGDFWERCVDLHIWGFGSITVRVGVGQRMVAVRQSPAAIYCVLDRFKCFNSRGFQI